MENASIFTRIINGEIPVHKIYEDDKVFAMLDSEPLADGHTLVVPKIQGGQIWELSDDYYTAIWNVARKLAMHMQEVLKPQRVGTIIEGFGVPDHGHIHLVPLYGDDVLQLPHKYPVDTSDENMKRLSEQLAFTD